LATLFLKQTLATWHVRTRITKGISDLRPPLYKNFLQSARISFGAGDRLFLVKESQSRLTATRAYSAPVQIL
jgi:hypothetical protein